MACPLRRPSGSSSPASTTSRSSTQHSEFEDRFLAIGPIDRGIVVVVYTEREEGRLRIIGARLATRREQDLYYSHKDEFK